LIYTTPNLLHKDKFLWSTKNIKILLEDCTQQVGKEGFHIPKISRILSQLNEAKDREE
jgi:hypothetical protein